MTASDIQHQIDKRLEWIKSLRERMAYADSSQARQADKKLITDYEGEISKLRGQLRDLGGADV